MLLDAISSPRCALFLGAGASHPLPKATDLKEALLDALLTVTDQAQSAEAKLVRLKRLAEPFMSLELLFTLFRLRLGDDAFAPTEILRSALQMEDAPSALKNLAILRRAGRAGSVLTTNFDDLLVRAHEATGAPYRFMTKAQLSGTSPSPQDIAALHGSVVTAEIAVSDLGPGEAYTPPVSAEARGFSRPFSADVAQYLRRVFANSDAVIFAGYRGADHFDVNLIFAEILESDPRFSDKTFWISFTGDGSDLDGFVRQHFAGRIFDARFDALMTDACVRAGVEPEQDGPSQQSGDAVAFRDELVAIWRRRARPHDAQALLRDLSANMAGSWVVREHYRLESIGFRQEQIQVFGGVSGGRGADLDFYGVDLGAVLRGQAEYAESRNNASQIKIGPSRNPDAQAAAYFETPAQTFAGAQDQIDAALGSDGLRPVDRAALLVGRAMAADYLGLIEGKIADLLMRAEGGSEKRLARHRLRRALAEFQACVKACDEADRIGDDVPDTVLADYAQSHIWRMIGEENRARTLAQMDSPRAVGAFNSAIRERRALIDRLERRGLEDEVPGQWPQLALRCGEFLKHLFSVHQPTDRPRLRFFERFRGRRNVRRSVEIGESAFEAFRDVAEPPNFRFIVLADGLLLAAYEQDDMPRMEGEIERLLDYFSSDFRRGGPRAPLFATQLETRLRVMADGSPHEGALVTMANRLRDSIAP